MEKPEKQFQVMREFDFEAKHQMVRTMIDREGEPWFVAKDVCDILEISNSRDAVQKLDDDERDDVGVTDAIGRMQRSNIVNESGLYNLIFRSDKPQAKSFRKWVTSEVLPALRKGMILGLPLNMTVPDDPAEALDLWVFIDKQKRTMQQRLRDIRELERSVLVRVKSGARPYHMPLDRQLGLQMTGPVENGEVQS